MWPPSSQCRPAAGRGMAGKDCPNRDPEAACDRASLGGTTEPGWRCAGRSFGPRRRATRDHGVPVRLLSQRGTKTRRSDFMFGENLDNEVCIGDRFASGSGIFEITKASPATGSASDSTHKSRSNAAAGATVFGHATESLEPHPVAGRYKNTRRRDLFMLQIPRTVPIGRRRLLLQAADALCKCYGRLIPRNCFERSSECT